MRKNAIIAAAITMIISSTQVLADPNTHCKDPVGVVMGTLECIENGDAQCASAAYADSFVKIHNGIDTHTVIDGSFWGNAFMLARFNFDINEAHRQGRDKVNISYVETVHISLPEFLANVLFAVFGVQFPNQTFTQNESAMVTVNSDCKMTLWDQTGNDAEQAAVEDYVGSIIYYLSMLR